MRSPGAGGGQNIDKLQDNMIGLIIREVGGIRWRQCCCRHDRYEDNDGGIFCRFSGGLYCICHRACLCGHF